MRGRPLAVSIRFSSNIALCSTASPCTSAPSTAPDPEHLRRLKTLVRRTGTPWLSDHLCWGSVDGTYTHDLLPLPYTWEAVERTAERVRMVQDYLEIPVAVENVSSYAAFTASEMTEWEFLNEVVERADCGILLDVNNIYVSAMNHEFDPMAYVNAVPAHRVAQIHIAGHSQIRKVHPRHARSSRHRSRVAALCARHRALRPDAHTAGVGRSHSELRRSPRRSERRPRSICTAHAEHACGGRTMNLENLQREMAAAVMQPLTADEQMRAHAADGRAMKTSRSRSSRPTAALPHSNAWKSTTGNIGFAFWARWPRIFRHCAPSIGSRAFERLSIEYLTAHPSRSFTLRNLGSQLAEWLAANPRYAGRRHALAVDVARIEWAFVEAFDSAERAPLTLEQIATLMRNPAWPCSRTCAYRARITRPTI